MPYMRMMNLLRPAVLLIGLALATSGCAGARAVDPAGRPAAERTPLADDGPFLYVANQDAASISVIDMTRNTVVTTVDLQQIGFSPNAKPHHVVVEPDGGHWYVSLIGENRVLKFDRQNEVVGQVELEVPGMLALDPESDRLYVGRSMTAVNPPSSIGVVDRSTMTLEEEVEVLFPRPHALALAPGGDHLYAASLAQNRFAVMDTETMEVGIETLDGPVHTFVQFAVAPDGRTLAVTGQMSGQLLFFDVTNPVDPELLDTVAVGAGPWHPVYTPDGRYLYLGNKMDNAVAVVDAAERRVVTVVEGTGLAQPHGSAARPDGRYVYISNNNTRGHHPHGHGTATEPGTVIVIDTETQEIASVIQVGLNPTGIGAPPPMK